MTTHRTRRGASRPRRRALLIDLDNITITGGAAISTAEAEALLDRILSSTGDSDFILAVAPRMTIVRYGAALARLGIRWHIVPVGPDTADLEILGVAAELATHGFAEFTIASADGIFADLCRLGRVRVCCRSGQPISYRLRQSASDLVAA